MFLVIQDNGYVINLNQISDIEICGDGYWEVSMASGNTFTVEGKELTTLKEMLGL